MHCVLSRSIGCGEWPLFTQNLSIQVHTFSCASEQLNVEQNEGKIRMDYDMPIHFRASHYSVILPRTWEKITKGWLGEHFYL